MTSIQRFNEWKQKCTDEQLLKELAAMENDLENMENAFYQDMEFGTAGIRGVIGAGTNRLNIYTISRITKGIANYMNDNNQKRVVICRDCRNFSNEFTLIAARVFAANGISVVITEDIMPTPFLSYMARNCGADIGVMITASHNPAEYNGYKVYNKHGYQLTDCDALRISEYIQKVEPFGIEFDSLDSYLNSGIISYLDQSVVGRYLDDVKKMSLGSAEGIKIVYSPLNGTGYKLVPEILRQKGIIDLAIVEAQSQPDGNFPTCKKPNPEKKETLELGIKLAQSLNYDIVLATDPDADRIGAAVKHDGQFVLLTGNEMGALLAEYLFAGYKEQGRLPSNPVLVKTIVTTPLAAKIAQSYGATCLDVLTGFKYIGETITQLEESGQEGRFILGFEESYGYLSGSYVRDKDAVLAAMLISEMAAKYKKEGSTLIDKLNQLYQRFGTYEHFVFSYEYPGAAGSRKMKQLLEDFRKQMPDVIADSKLTSVTDFLLDDTGLPKTNALRLINEVGSQLIIRPSGTEPLIKFYITVSKTPQENRLQIQGITKAIEDFFRP